MGKSKSIKVLQRCVNVRMWLLKLNSNSPCDPSCLTSDSNFSTTLKTHWWMNVNVYSYRFAIKHAHWACTLCMLDGEAIRILDLRSAGQPDRSVNFQSTAKLLWCHGRTSEQYFKQDCTLLCAVWGNWWGYSYLLLIPQCLWCIFLTFLLDWNPLLQSHW